MDVTYAGSYTVNYYTVTFKIGGEVIYSESLPYGSPIVAPEAPAVEGKVFSGWGKVAETVPAMDVTYEGHYINNPYEIIYYVDGVEYYRGLIEFGATIALIDEPTKEGHTFSGWSEVPATMPADDITITGTFTVNTYTVTFTIDGMVIASSTQEYGSAITVPSAPTREGYTFSGWGEVPTTMPASDVTYDATYIPNTYKVYYFVGHKLVHVAEVAYGEVIPEYIYEPTTEGDVFMGWIGDTYDTMPAHDVTYTANIANGIENSEINTLNSEFIYDLAGRNVLDTENLKGGVYIINGREVMVGG
jgi:hypothetical protein